MSRLPTDWKCDRLKDVSAINADSLPADTDPDYEFDYLEISNVDYHGIVDSKAIERLRYEDAPSRARRRVAKNCTMISSVRPNLQAVAFANNGRKDFVCSTGFNVVQPLEHKLFSKFGYYSSFPKAHGNTLRPLQKVSAIRRLTTKILTRLMCRSRRWRSNSASRHIWMPVARRLMPHFPPNAANSKPSTPYAPRWFTRQ